MRKIRLALTLATAAVIAIAGTTLSAWDWMKPFKRPSKDVRLLIVCGNYTKHRALAELIQIETSQPILLLPAVYSGKVFFMPARKDALEIEDAKFTNFVKFTKPEKILIIDDGGPVTRSYLDRIDPYQTKVIVFNKNLEQMAVELGKILDITDLADNFAKICKDIDSGKLYRSGSAVSKPASPISGVSADASKHAPAPILPALQTAPKAEPVLMDEDEVVPK